MSSFRSLQSNRSVLAPKKSKKAALYFNFSLNSSQTNLQIKHELKRFVWSFTSYFNHTIPFHLRKTHNTQLKFKVKVSCLSSLLYNMIVDCLCLGYIVSLINEKCNYSCKLVSKKLYLYPINLFLEKCNAAWIMFFFYQHNEEAVLMNEFAK